MAQASVHFVYKSVSTKIYLFPLLDVVSGPIQSNETSANGPSAGIGLRNPIFLGLVILIPAQIRQVRTHSFTSSRIPGHQYLLAIFSSVFVIPRWPPASLSSWYIFITLFLSPFGTAATFLSPKTRCTKLPALSNLNVRSPFSASLIKWLSVSSIFWSLFHSSSIAPSCSNSVGTLVNASTF